MAIKKSQLYSALWESCNALRGSMDASQYKDATSYIKDQLKKAFKGNKHIKIK